MRRAYRTERGSFFKELYSTFFVDDQIRYVHEQIEAGASIFRDGFGTGDIEEQPKRQRANRGTPCPFRNDLLPVPPQAPMSQRLGRFRIQHAARLFG
jgi:hypothetical protein